MIIDITNEVLTNLKNTLTDVTVLSSYPSTVPQFPCITVQELPNTTDPTTIDTSGEHYCDAGIEINIYSNAPNKSTQAKNIRNRIDTIMSGTYRMTREFSDEVPNYVDTDIYRYILRYTFVIDENKQIYRR